MANKTGKGYFQAGNKQGGRKPIDPAFRALAEENSIEALRVIIEIMKNAKNRPVARLMAAQTIIERVYGKANQPLSNPDGSPLTVNVINYAGNNNTV